MASEDPGLVQTPTFSLLLQFASAGPHRRKIYQTGKPPGPTGCQKKEALATVRLSMAFFCFQFCLRLQVVLSGEDFCRERTDKRACVNVCVSMWMCVCSYTYLCVEDSYAYSYDCACMSALVSVLVRA